MVMARRRQDRETRFMGVDNILAEDPREPAGDSFPSFARSPRIACSDKATRLGLLRGLQLWRSPAEVGTPERPTCGVNCHSWETTGRNAMDPCSGYARCRRPLMGRRLFCDRP